MYANTSEQFNFEFNATNAELQSNEFVRQTWWNRSAGPLILTTVLAPAALTVMWAGFLLLSGICAAISVTERLTRFSTDY